MDVLNNKNSLHHMQEFASVRTKRKQSSGTIIGCCSRRQIDLQIISLSSHTYHERANKILTLENLVGAIRRRITSVYSVIKIHLKGK